MNKNAIRGAISLDNYHRILKIMKITAFFLFMGIFFAQAGAGYSQGTKLTLNLRSASVREVCNQIENQSNYFFVFSDDAENALNKKINISVDSENIEEVLENVFSSTNLKYKILDKQVVVYLNNEKKTEIIAESSPTLQPEQTRTVTGKVTDTSGEPLPGATVMVKGTTIGTVTDADGNFTLRIPANAQTLQVSFVGMKTKEIPIAGRTTFNVRLEEEAVGLEEVVAVGYGTMKKSDLTGAISSVPMNLIKDQPLPGGLNDLLQGRVAGMTLIKSSGDIAATIKTRIRGPNSIKGDNSPLYVVDGVIGGSYGSAYDIESIEVLKDASATAIYGERASNGVILITTKKATSAEPKIRIQLNTGYRTQNVNYPDKMNAAEYAEHVNDLRESEIYSADEIEDFRENGGTNWTDLVMQSGIIQDYYISYSQKIDKLGVYLSGRYNEADGVLVNSKSEGNYDLRSKVTFEPSKRLSFVLDLNVGKSKRKNGGLSTGNDKTDPIFQSLIWSPTEPVWKDEENGIYNLQDHYGSLLENPYKTAMEQNNLVMAHNISTMLIANLKITDWLSYNVTGYANKSASQNASYENEWINPADPQAYRSSNDSFQWRLINSVNINKSFDDTHNVLFTGVYEAEAGESWYVNGLGRNMPLPDLAQYYKIDMSNIQSASSSFGEWSRIAWLARLNYNYLSRYLFYCIVSC
jgi:TonB-linked SusC/RagA family outer membrane protein